MLVHINTWLLLCGQIWRSSSWRNKWMSKQEQQADHHQPYSWCLLTGTESPATAQCSSSTCYTHQTGTLFQRQPTDQPEKNLLAAVIYTSPQHFSAVSKCVIPYTFTISRNSYSLCTAQQCARFLVFGYTPLVVLSFSSSLFFPSRSQSMFCSTAQTVLTGLPCNLW